MRHLHTSISIAVLLSVSAYSPAHAVIDADAAVVKLRTSCSEGGAALDNCFTSMSTLTDWIWNIRNPQPSAGAPLLVEIGPGDFNGSFNCQNSGHITLRGSGPEQTRITSGYPLSSTNCTELAFEDLTIEGNRASNLTLVFWNGGGISRWTNVDLITYGYGWIDQNCAATPGQHYWFSSRIIGYSSFNSLRNYITNCDVTWFIGSEITSIADTQTSYINTIIAADEGEVHVYGSVVRTLSEAGVNTAPFSTSGVFVNSFAPISAMNGGEIHIHGSAIDAISVEGNEINVLTAEGGGLIHANTASYNIQTGSGGSVHRIRHEVGGHVHAPYTWEAHAEPPFAGSGIAFSSQEGADLAVTTNNADGYPHLNIYTDQCTSKWFDTVTGACR